MKKTSFFLSIKMSRVPLVLCEKCGRSFAEESLVKHSKNCMRSKNSSRFDIIQHYTRNTPSEGRVFCQMNPPVRVFTKSLAGSRLGRSLRAKKSSHRPVAPSLPSTRVSTVQRMKERAIAASKTPSPLVADQIAKKKSINTCKLVLDVAPINNSHKTKLTPKERTVELKTQPIKSDLMPNVILTDKGIDVYAFLRMRSEKTKIVEPPPNPIPLLPVFNNGLHPLARENLSSGDVRSFFVPNFSTEISGSPVKPKSRYESASESIKLANRRPAHSRA